MDPQVESKAIKILATQGQKKYHEFLKSKGELDFLSDEEVATIWPLRDFDYQTVCECIMKSRPVSGLASVPQFASTPVAESASADVRERVSSDVLFSPPTGNETIHCTLLDMISKAQKDVLVAMFSFTDAGIFKALYTKATAGVTVNMVLDGSQLFRFTKMIRNPLNCATFSAKPDNMYIGVIAGTGGEGSRVGLAHEKFMVVDCNYAFTGSYNFTWGAANINRELGVFTTHAGGGTPPTLITKLRRHHIELKHDSTPYPWPN